MLYTVSELSDLINLSKVSIYKKLKLKELEGHIIKKTGITYIDEVGFNLLKDSLKLNDDVKSDLNNKDIESPLSEETDTDTEDLTINTELVKTLIEQLKTKDIQIQELNNRLAKEQELHQNTQVLYRQEQEKPKQDLLLLEEHLKEFDDRLMTIKEDMELRKEIKDKESKSWLKKIIGK